MNGGGNAFFYFTQQFRVIEYGLQVIFRESELKRMVTTTAQYKKTESHFDSSRNIVRVLFD